LLTKAAACDTAHELHVRLLVAAACALLALPEEHWQGKRLPAVGVVGRAGATRDTSSCNSDDVCVSGAVVCCSRGELLELLLGATLQCTGTRGDAHNDVSTNAGDQGLDDNGGVLMQQVAEVAQGAWGPASLAALLGPAGQAGSSDTQRLCHAAAVCSQLSSTPEGAAALLASPCHTHPSSQMPPLLQHVLTQLAHPSAPELGSDDSSVDASRWQLASAAVSALICAPSVQSLAAQLDWASRLAECLAAALVSSQQPQRKPVLAAATCTAATARLLLRLLCGVPSLLHIWQTPARNVSGGSVGNKSSYFASSPVTGLLTHQCVAELQALAATLSNFQQHHHQPVTTPDSQQGGGNVPARLSMNEIAAAAGVLALSDTCQRQLFAAGWAHTLLLNQTPLQLAAMCTELQRCGVQITDAALSHLLRPSRTVAGAALDAAHMQQPSSELTAFRAMQSCLMWVGAVRCLLPNQHGQLPYDQPALVSTSQPGANYDVRDILQVGCLSFNCSVWVCVVITIIIVVVLPVTVCAGVGDMAGWPSRHGADLGCTGIKTEHTAGGGGGTSGSAYVARQLGLLPTHAACIERWHQRTLVPGSPVGQGCRSHRFRTTKHAAFNRSNCSSGFE
jgi:hypothetical protein